MMMLMPKRTNTPALSRSQSQTSLIPIGWAESGLAGGVPAQAKLPKSDERKILLARILRKRNSVSNDWIASRLAMGHPGSVGRLISAGRSDQKLSEWPHALNGTINNDVDSM